MRSMMTYSIRIFVVLLTSFTSRASAGQIDTSEGKVINTGLVFVDGKFLNPPYRVSRICFALYINDVQIRRPKRHMDTPIIDVGDPNLLSEQDKGRVLRMLEATRNIYENNLQQGCCYIFSSAGGHVLLSPYSVAYSLPNVLRMLSVPGLTEAEKVERLRQMNYWHVHIDVEVFVKNFSSSLQLEERIQQQAEALLWIEKFGVGQPGYAESGFLFLGGQYLEAPYVIQRRGLGVFVNNRLVYQPPVWPIRVYSGDVDPQLPQTISDESSWFDAEVQEYLKQKQAFVRNKFGPDAEADIMAQVISSLPLVTEWRREGDILHIRTTEGLELPVLLSSTEFEPEPVDEKLIVQLLQERCQMLADQLNRGCCLFICSSGGGALWPSSRVSELIPLVTILGSGRPIKEKTRMLEAAGLFLIHEVIEELAENFVPSQQLCNRIGQLVESSVVQQK